MHKLLLATIILPLFVTAAAANRAQGSSEGMAPPPSVAKAQSRQSMPTLRAFEGAASNAYGMATGSFLKRNSNSPEEAGGGSFGYNQKLLEY